MSIEPLRVWAGPLGDVDVANRLVRLGINPIVLAHRDDRFEPEQQRDRYGSLLTHYALTDIGDAEIAVVPLAYEKSGNAELRAVVDRAERAGLPTLVLARHDIEPLMPSESIILLHPGPTRGAQPRARSLALPYFFSDRARTPEIRPDGDRPSVAFCGQGATRPAALAANTLRRAADLVAQRVRPRHVPPHLGGHLPLRAATLDALRCHKGVDDHFVIRDQYRAGSTSTIDRARTQAEFDDNLRAATYALCVRGTGNFSARFYEALSFGRVPLFVDTQCVLPFEDEIDWRSRTVWVDSADASAIGDRLVAAHTDVLGDPNRRAEVLRQLWEDRLTSHGYFRHLVPTLRAML